MPSWRGAQGEHRDNMIKEFMEKSPSWGASSCPASQEITGMEYEFSLPWLQEPATGPTVFRVTWILSAPSHPIL
jgi:hypothetical protein